MPDSPELAAFKERLWNVTEQTANNYGWCGTWRDAMRDLGVGPAVEKEYEIRVTYKVTANGTDANGLHEALRYSAGPGGAAMSIDTGRVPNVNWTMDGFTVIDPDDVQPF